MIVLNSMLNANKPLNLCSDVNVNSEIIFLMISSFRRVSLLYQSYLSLKSLLAEPSVEEKKEDPFLNIAPKKPNWDLRRDVQKKLDKLVKRTQKALYQLMGM
ncbi:coiled-coil domain-containing protein 12 [Tanacetum coccineum]